MRIGIVTAFHMTGRSETSFSHFRWNSTNSLLRRRLPGLCPPPRRAFLVHAVADGAPCSFVLQRYAIQMRSTAWHGMAEWSQTCNQVISCYKLSSDLQRKNSESTFNPTQANSQHFTAPIGYVRKGQHNASHTNCNFFIYGVFLYGFCGFAVNYCIDSLGNRSKTEYQTQSWC